MLDDWNYSEQCIVILISTKSMPVKATAFYLCSTGLPTLVSLHTHESLSYLSCGRVRDKIGHGELDIKLDSDQGQEEALANILMAVCLILMQKPRSYSYSRLFRQFFNEYKPLYHPSSKLKTNIKKIIRDLDRLDCEKFCGIFTESPKIETQDSNIDQDEFIHLIDCHSPRTLYRPREEYELLQILIKMTENILLAIDRIHENLEEKYSLLVKMELRSRQRKTLQRALNLKFYRSLNSCFVNCVAISFLYSKTS